MAKKFRKGDDRLDELQELKQENRHLRKQIASLRKQISRNDHFQDLKEEINTNEETINPKKDLNRLCYDCQKSSLKLIIFERSDGVWYVRRCPNCGRKTRMKRHNDKVEE